MKLNTIVKQIIGDQDEAPMHDIYLNNPGKSQAAQRVKGKSKETEVSTPCDTVNGVIHFMELYILCKSDLDKIT